MYKYILHARSMQIPGNVQNYWDIRGWRFVHVKGVVKVDYSITRVFSIFASSVLDSMLKTVQEPEMARHIAELSDRKNYSTDESKRPGKDSEPAASFRKLNID